MDIRLQRARFQTASKNHKKSLEVGNCRPDICCLSNGDHLPLRTNNPNIHGQIYNFPYENVFKNRDDPIPAHVLCAERNEVADTVEKKISTVQCTLHLLFFPPKIESTQGYLSYHCSTQQIYSRDKKPTGQLTTQVPRETHS